MAAPLFVTDEVTLEAALRLTAVPASALDTQAIIDGYAIMSRDGSVVISLENPLGGFGRQ